MNTHNFCFLLGVIIIVLVSANYFNNKIENMQVRNISSGAKNYYPYDVTISSKNNCDELDPPNCDAGDMYTLPQVKSTVKGTTINVANYKDGSHTKTFITGTPINLESDEYTKFANNYLINLNTEPTITDSRNSSLLSYGQNVLMILLPQIQCFLKLFL